MTTRFLYMADCHVKTRTWTNDAGITGDAFAALDSIPQWFAENGEAMPDTLLLGGDLFDGNRPSSLELLKTLDFIRNFKSTYYIRGNHDSVQPPFVTAACDPLHSDVLVNVLAPDVALVPQQGCWICGIPWLPREQLMEQLAKLKDLVDHAANDAPVLCMLHCGVKELLGFDGTWQVDCNTLHDMFAGHCVVFLVGHVHKRDSIRLGDGVCIHSPGPLYPCSWDEALRESPAVSLVQICDGSVSVTAVPCDMRWYRRVKWTSMEDLNARIREIKDTWAPRPLLPVIRIETDGPCGFRNQDLEDTAVIVRIHDNSVADDGLAVPEGETAYCMDDAVREEISDDDMADMAVALLHSDDPVMEIESWLKQWGVARI